jgi:hypothetical protein
MTAVAVDEGDELLLPSGAALERGQARRAKAPPFAAGNAAASMEV